MDAFLIIIGSWLIGHKLGSAVGWGVFLVVVGLSESISDDLKKIGRSK